MLHFFKGNRSKKMKDTNTEKMNASIKELFKTNMITVQLNMQFKIMSPSQLHYKILIKKIKIKRERQVITQNMQYWDQLPLLLMKKAIMYSLIGYV